MTEQCYARAMHPNYKNVFNTSIVFSFNQCNYLSVSLLAITCIRKYNHLVRNSYIVVTRLLWNVSSYVRQEHEVWRHMAEREVVISPSLSTYVRLQSKLYSYLSQAGKVYAATYVSTKLLSTSVSTFYV